MEGLGNGPEMFPLSKPPMPGTMPPTGIIAGPGALFAF